MPRDPLEQFLNDVLGLHISIPDAIKPSQPWPSPQEIDGAIVQLEKQLQAERGESE